MTILFDSGAYSVWTKNKKVNIDAYIKFCLTNLDKIDYIVSLDVIPGTPNKKNISLQEIEKCAQQGWDNYKYMLRKGIPKKKLVHVFHYGETFKWLERIRDNMDYIGLSPTSLGKVATNEKICWLDKCMKYITDDAGFATVKFHGFGITNPLLLLRYPWYSVDSSSWLRATINGKIYLPDILPGGDFDYENMFTIHVSKIKSLPYINKFLDIIPISEKEKNSILENNIKDEKKERYIRAIINVFCFTQFEKVLKKKGVKFNKKNNLLYQFFI